MCRKTGEAGCVSVLRCRRFLLFFFAVVAKEADVKQLIVGVKKGVPCHAMPALLVN